MNVSIVNYSPEFKQAFRDLNYEWINKYFKVEASDLKMLENPETYILAPGGVILIALYEGEPVGTSALIKMENGTYELAKMSVAPNMQGKKIGLRLGEAVIEKAKELKASKLFLETNSTLKPALALYEKLGFSEVSGLSSPYDRCNVQMELVL